MSQVTAQLMNTYHTSSHRFNTRKQMCVVYSQDQRNTWQLHENSKTLQISTQVSPKQAHVVSSLPAGNLIHSDTLKPKTCISHNLKTNANTVRVMHDMDILKGNCKLKYSRMHADPPGAVALTVGSAPRRILPKLRHFHWLLKMINQIDIV